MTLKSDAKVEEKLTHFFKNDMSNLVDFTEGVKILKFCTLMGLFCPKYIMIQVKIFIGVMGDDTGE